MYMQMMPLYIPRFPTHTYEHIQCAKKHTSHRPGRVIYNVGQVDLSIDLTFFALIYWQIIDKLILQKAELIRKLSVSAIVRLEMLVSVLLVDS